jgi:preprotein translocase subunit SecB
VAATESEQEPVFKFQKAYLKDASFESPSAPQVFADTKPQEVSVQCTIKHRAMDKRFYEVVLSVKVEARKDDTPSFLAELQQAGVFEISGVPGEDLPRVLEITCPDMLMAFAREAVCDLVVKGGFPQLLIDPVNFQWLYEQRQAALREPGPAPS